MEVFCYLFFGMKTVLVYLIDRLHCKERLLIDSARTRLHCYRTQTEIITSVAV